MPLHLLGVLDEGTRSAVLRLGTRIRLTRDDVLFHQGDESAWLYVIRHGKVKIGRKSSDGREILLAVFGPGEVLGELNLLDRAPRTTTATALTGAEVLRLRVDHLLDLLHERPALARGLLAVIARQLRRTNDSVSALISVEVPGRLAVLTGHVG